ncbi:hypothetical protein FRC02_007647 [Tulasnella sp. 418]|nr:hypothetical protein FRC02_007647 [Tulasnella sp. 418]
MHSRREVPIVAGGTLYWVQHLLFPNRLLSLESDDSQRAGSSAPSIAPLSPELRISLSKLSKEEQTLFDNLPDRSRSEPDHLSEDAAWSLHSLLSKLDPVTGARWHWKDSRKIVRSLEIIKESGRKASDVFADQRKVECDSRYPSLIFWLHAEKDQLNPRLDARVEKMVERGLIAEITSFRSLADTLPKLSAEPENGLDPDIDYTHGILQTIGFKEFDKYLSSSDKQSQLFDEAVEQMKLATRKYAKRQVRWIKQQLLPVIQNQTGVTKRSRLVALDASDLGRWDQNVKEPAIRALADFLSGHALRDIEMIPQLQLMVPAHDSVSER